MKRILVGTIAVMMAMPVMADDTPAVGDKTTTSQPYVETQVGLKQGLIPAAGTNSATAGSTVVTYTATSGEIGERELFTGGEYTAGTDADKLITASALNTAFTTLPTTDTTTLACANQSGGCTLWTIVDQTAYGVSSGSGGGGNGGASLMHNYLLTNEGSCADGNGLDRLDGSLAEQGPCYDPTFGEMTHGDWCANLFFTGDDCRDVIGNSACSTVVTEADPYYAYNGGVIIPANQSQINTDYASNVASVPNSNPVGRYCYCRLTKANGNSAVSSWAYADTYDTPGDCARYCSGTCGTAVYIQGGPGSFANGLFETVP